MRPSGSYRNSRRVARHAVRDAVLVGARRIRVHVDFLVVVVIVVQYVVRRVQLRVLGTTLGDNDVHRRARVRRRVDQDARVVVRDDEIAFQDQM